MSDIRKPPPHFTDKEHLIGRIKYLKGVMGDVVNKLEANGYSDKAKELDGAKNTLISWIEKIKKD